MSTGPHEHDDTRDDHDGTADAPLDAGTGPDESQPVLDAEPDDDERFDAG